MARCLRRRARLGSQPLSRKGVSMRVLGLLLIGLLLAAPPVLAQAPVQDEADIQRVLDALLDAVNSADMSGFLAFFDTDATMFHYLAHPPGTPPRRLQGRTDIRQSMSAVFDQVKASSGRTTGPYIQIRPLDLMIQTFDQFAVVSFHLGGESAISRRTIVFRNLTTLLNGQVVASAWKVVHIHGSLLQTGTPD